MAFCKREHFVHLTNNSRGARVGPETRRGQGGLPRVWVRPRPMSPCAPIGTEIRPGYPGKAAMSKEKQSHPRPESGPGQRLPAGIVVSSFRHRKRKSARSPNSVRRAMESSRPQILLRGDCEGEDGGSIRFPRQRTLPLSRFVLSRRMSPIPRLRVCSGPALLSYGFRPFFLFGAVYAGLGIVIGCRCSSAASRSQPRMHVCLVKGAERPVFGVR